MIQYVSDDGGNHTAVLVPIDEWNEINADLQELKAIKKEKVKESPKKKPSDYIGTLSDEEAQKFREYVEQSRNERERNF